ncbi:hypothetical protein [Butyrivibrio proteoclasticus]|uniref:hypothetical protein n=1 Tax=Butyrivibrio proteoclasticus TaxID=43305 RepID=UPI00047EDA4B|nr:hypothetical protein [Butyrivibrio proteoclasticus]
MKIREKFGKQNNSVKVLLKKLKRHDTFVVAIAVVIALLLCGGLIYISTPVAMASAKDEFTESMEESDQLTMDKLAEIHDYLTSLDELITSNYEGLSSFYQESDEDSKEMSESVKEKVTTLEKNLGTIHETVSGTETKIEELKTLMEGGNKDSKETKEQMTKDFSEVKAALDNIKSNYDKAQADTKSLMEEIQNNLKDGNQQLSQEMTENYNTLLTKLGDINTSMETYNQQLILAFQTDIDKVMSGVDNGFGDLTKYLSDCMDGINGKLDKVFQYVSDGKRMLASALLTKNVTVAEDATFEQIRDAILSIPQTFVLDSKTPSYNIAYDYHYHIDGNKEVCNEELVDASRKGGCYTKEVKHVHTDACYTTTIEYRYRTNQGVARGNKVGVYYTGENMFNYKCGYCGYSWVGTNAWHDESSTDPGRAASRGGRDEKAVTVKTLKCTKTAATIDGYTTECGYLHGQILCAHVSFDEKTTVTSSSNLEGGRVLTEEELNTSAIATNAAENSNFNMNEGLEALLNGNGGVGYSEDEDGTGVGTDDEAGTGASAEEGAGAGESDESSGKNGSADGSANGSASSGANDDAGNGTNGSGSNAGNSSDSGNGVNENSTADVQNGGNSGSESAGGSDVESGTDVNSQGGDSNESADASDTTPSGSNEGNE